MAETGVFGVYMACDVKKVEQCIDLLMAEFRALRKNSIKSEAFDRIKCQIKGNLFLGMESTSRRMRKIGESEIMGREHLSVEQVLQKVDNLKSADLTESLSQPSRRPSLSMSG